MSPWEGGGGQGWTGHRMVSTELGPGPGTEDTVHAVLPGAWPQGDQNPSRRSTPAPTGNWLVTLRGLGFPCSGRAAAPFRGGGASGKASANRVWPESRELAAPRSLGLVAPFGRGRGPLCVPVHLSGGSREPSGQAWPGRSVKAPVAPGHHRSGPTRPGGDAAAGDQALMVPPSLGCVTSTCHSPQTKHHSPGGLNSINVFSPGPGGRESEIQARAGRFPRRPPCAACRCRLVPGSSRGGPSVCLCPDPLFLQDTGPRGSGSTSPALPFSKHSRGLKHRRLGRPRGNVGEGDTRQPTAAPLPGVGSPRLTLLPCLVRELPR